MAKTLGAPQAPAAPSDPVRQRTALAQDEEQAFQHWYGIMAQAAGLDPNPDDPRHAYDWRGAWKSGARAVLDPSDGRPHWPSEFKDADHPTRITGGRDTATGEQVAPTGGRLTPLADYLMKIADGNGATPSPVSPEARAEGARRTLQGLEGPTTVPAGSRRMEPETMTDALPAHRQTETGVEEAPGLFLDEDDAKDIPRPGETYSPREADAFQERKRGRRSLGGEGVAG